MKTLKSTSFLATAFVIFLLMACSSSSSNETLDEMTQSESASENTNTETDEETSEDGLTPKTTYDITSIISKLTETEAVTHKIVGDYVYFYSTGIPNHGSPYFLDTEWEATKYEAYSGNGFNLNPNRVAAQEYEFRIPLHPSESNNKTATPMGPMGISINGVPFYNQYAAGGTSLDGEIKSFDQYNGHPARVGNYHYHIEPLFLTSQKGEDALLGVLLDGFPVYGPMENGKTISSDDLDEYHGHFGATADFPEGIYHYHISADAPYINGDGFFGTPGTASN